MSMNILNFVFQRTFQYTSCIWTNKNGYNLAGGKTGFDTKVTTPYQGGLPVVRGKRRNDYVFLTLRLILQTY